MQHDAIVLPQLFQAEVMFKPHGDQAHQGIDKVLARIRQRFICPGMNDAVRKWVKACRVCQKAKMLSVSFCSRTLSVGPSIK